MRSVPNNDIMHYVIILKYATMHYSILEGPCHEPTDIKSHLGLEPLV
jgi:hypothetical protein